MSANIVCPHCFKTNSYTSTAPKFCGFCGKSFLDAFESSASSQEEETVVVRRPAAPTRTQQPKRPRVIIEEEYQETEETSTIPQIDKIEIIIDGNLRPNRDKFENVINTGALGISRPKNNPNQKNKPKKLSKEEVARNWKDNFPKTRSIEIGGSGE